ncbi:MAG: YcaO-like family protein, partial [Rhizobiaceae bacterium]|nr:YcaO-like family protein [Rhizobiaceae bacterium]
IEIWHAEHFDKPVLYGIEKDLTKRHRIADTDRLPKVLGSDYTRSDPMLWVEGVDCFTNERALVPYEMVHADYTHPGPPIHSVFHASTNGLASGNHRLEAICHAITELMERDALTLWHQLTSREKSATRLDVSTIDNPQSQELLKKLETAGLECGLWDVTSDIDVPCVLALIRETDGATGHLGLGSGCHLDRSVATRRALTEAAQTRLNYISGARDDLHLSEYSLEGLAEKLAFADELFDLNTSFKTFHGLPSNTFSSLEQDLDHLLSSLSAVGIKEAIAVELTRPEVGVDVIRMVIPGLESPHDDETYQPGERAGALQNGR